MAAFLLAALPCIAFAQWRVVAVTPEVEAMRFDTILDAHSYMKDYSIEEEEGNGVYVGESLYPSASYVDGRYVSWVCFRYVGADGDFDPDTCTGEAATE